MRINAYILAADPTWICTSVLAYYEHVDRIIVSYDRQGRGWQGTPVDTAACLDALRQIDADDKMVFAPDDWSNDGKGLPDGETLQRQSALDQASKDADWVLQIDSDEVLPRFDSLLSCLREADIRGLDAVEWPMRVLYRSLRGGRHLEVTTTAGNLHVEYPGPVAVRAAASLAYNRRIEGSWLRPVVDGLEPSLQIAGPPVVGEHRLQVLAPGDVIWHNSWARNPTAVLRKVRSWSHNDGAKSFAYFLLTWLPAPLTWRLRRNLHPFADGLWDRLAISEPIPFGLHEDDQGYSLRLGMTVRDLLKGLAPDPVVRLVRWRRDIWSDLRLRLLTDIGRVPSHRIRAWFYRRAGLSLPSSSSIHWRAEFYSPERITIGEYTTIGDSAFLDGRSGLTIGERVNLGSHVVIWTRQHDIVASDFAEVGAPVHIEDYAYIGSHATLLPGVKVGQGGVVGAGSVVTKDVPPYTLVAGSPARVIRRRSEQLDYKLGYAKRFV